MPMSFRKKCALTCALAMGVLSFSMAAPAATLTGDNVAVSINDGVYTSSGVVGAGNDVDILSLLFFDFNLGVDGTGFQFSTEPGFYCGVANCTGPLKIALTSLDFSGGEQLIGFANLVSFFANTSFSFTGNSLTFIMDEGLHSGGILLTGNFQTTASAVPIPAALPLLAAGLGAMGFMGWRRKRKALA